MASPTRWTWIWVNSRSWWWTGRPGVLQFMGSQRVGQLSDWTELNTEVCTILNKLESFLMAMKKWSSSNSQKELGYILAETTDSPKSRSALISVDTTTWRCNQEPMILLFFLTPMVLGFILKLVFPWLSGSRKSSGYMLPCVFWLGLLHLDTINSYDVWTTSFFIMLYWAV